MTSSITKAVVPLDAAPGLLPATTTIPIELLPLAGVPMIERIVAAAGDVGLTDLLLVCNSGDQSREDHVDHAADRERRRTDRDDRAGLLAVRRRAALATVHAIHGRRTLGAADAIGLARRHVGDEPFVLLAADRLVDLEHHLLDDLMTAHARAGVSVAAVAGDVDPAHVTARDLGRYGRYVLTPEVFGVIDHLATDLGGHRQLADALLALRRRGRLDLVSFDSDVCDVGDRLDRVRVELQVLLADPDEGSHVHHVSIDALRDRLHAPAA